jgi:hypothetical protein
MARQFDRGGVRPGRIVDLFEDEGIGDFLIARSDLEP